MKKTYNQGDATQKFNPTHFENWLRSLPQEQLGSIELTAEERDHLVKVGVQNQRREQMSDINNIFPGLKNKTSKTSAKEVLTIEQKVAAAEKQVARNKTRFDTKRSAGYIAPRKGTRWFVRGDVVHAMPRGMSDDDCKLALDLLSASPATTSDTAVSIS